MESSDSFSRNLLKFSKLISFFNKPNIEFNTLLNADGFLIILEVSNLNSKGNFKSSKIT